MAEIKVKENIKANRLLLVDGKPSDYSLGYASSKANFVSLSDIDKDSIIQATTSEARVWRVEAEKSIKAKDNISVGSKGMAKPSLKKDTVIGIALNDAKKGEIVKVKRTSN